MLFFLQLLQFFFFAYLSFYIPGKLLIWVLRVKYSECTSFILSWVFGVAVFTLVSYLSAWAGVTKLPLVLLFITLLIFLKYRLYRVKINFITLDRKSLFIILLGSLAFLFLDFQSGSYSSKGLQFFGTNSVDGFILLAYIQNMTNHFPPTRPGLAGIEMRGYHYFYPFLLSRFSLFFGFNPIDLLFRHFALFTSLLYGASFYLLGGILRISQKQKLWVLVVAYFGRSFIPLISDSVLLYTGVVDPLGLIHNPSWLLAISFLLTGWAVVLSEESNRRKAVIAGLLIGVIAQTKVYAGIIGLIGMGTLILWQLVCTRKIVSTYNLFLVTVTAFLITAITYLPSNWGQGSLVWAPGLYYEHFIAQDKFDSWHWYIKKTIFLEHNNLARLLLLYLQAVTLFWALSIGSRVLLLLGINELHKKKLYQSSAAILLFCSTVAALLIPSFFIQSQGVFDIGQFLWLAVALLSIPTGIVVGSFLEKNRSILVRVIIICIALVPGLVGYAQDFSNNGLKEPEVVVSYPQLDILNEINHKVDPSQFIVFLPNRDPGGKIIWPHAPYVSALSARSVYYEKSSTPFDAGGIEKARLANLDQLYSYTDQCQIDQAAKTMQKLDAKYLLSEKQIDCKNSDNFIADKLEKKGLFLYQIRYNQNK